MLKKIFIYIFLIINFPISLTVYIIGNLINLLISFLKNILKLIHLYFNFLSRLTRSLKTIKTNK